MEDWLAVCTLIVMLPIVFKVSPHSKCFIFRLRSCTSPPMWHQPTSSPSQPSTPIKRGTPNAHSSPRAALKGPAVRPGIRVESDSTDLSSLLTLNGDLEHSLPEAMGDLWVPSLGGDGELPPQLPEKRRAAEGGDLGSCVPNSLGSFSSPHCESSLSLSFSSPSPEPFKAFSGTPSPGAGGKRI